IRMPATPAWGLRSPATSPAATVATSHSGRVPWAAYARPCVCRCRAAGVPPDDPCLRLRQIWPLPISSPSWIMVSSHNALAKARLSMDRAAEIGLLKKLLHYLDTKTTSMAEAPWRNDVTAYTSPERHKREEEILIRKRPVVMGLSCDWPKPG